MRSAFKEFAPLGADSFHWKDVSQDSKHEENKFAHNDDSNFNSIEVLQTPLFCKIETLVHSSLIFFGQILASTYRLPVYCVNIHTGKTQHSAAFCMFVFVVHKKMLCLSEHFVELKIKQFWEKSMPVNF